jgi:RimJ/RimL family protein N-acetyltransferase
MRTTERLLLRPYREEDRPAFAAINADPEVMKYLGGVPLTREQSDEITVGVNERYVAEGIGFLAIERRSDGALLGACGLMRHTTWYPDDLEIGWRLGRQYWGHGYATEAARSWLAHAFEDRAEPRVISITDTPNLNSIAVMKRLGMTLDHQTVLVDEGTPFDATIYSITAEAWTTLHR